MAETEPPPKKNVEQEQKPQEQTPEDKAAEELGKRAQKSTRYERHKIKEQRERAEKVFEKLKKGEVPKLDLEKMSPADIKEAKSIIADIERAHEQKWLTKGEIPDNPIVLDVVARIASAPQELQDDPKWLIAQGLELREAQKGSMPDDVKIAIQKVSYRIRNRVTELTGINEEDRHAIFRSSFDPAKLTSVTPEQAEVVEVAEFYLSESGSPVRRGSGTPELITPSDWLYKGQTTGNAALDKKLEEINNRYANEPQAEYLQEAHRELKDMKLAEAEPYLRTIENTYKIMSDEQFRLTPAEIEKIKNPDTRDEVFYRRIEKILNKPNKTSRESMDLYTQTALDSFTYGVSRMENGRNLVAHFENLQEAIFAFHDIDFYARSAAGDVKPFVEAASYFQNSFAIEAINDPLVEVSIQSYEQALKMIRDNNDGYIPPSMVSYDTNTYQNYWDELAKKILIEKIKAGLVHDYDRDPKTGTPLKNNDGTRRFKDEAMTLEELGLDPKSKLSVEDQRNKTLRLIASMRMAKGFGILDMRLLEIFAFSKTPGYSNPEYGTQGLIFSSKAYEGIARWLNPMADWFGKFKMGDTMFAPFFATLIGIKHNDLKEFFSWDQDQWKRITNMAANGELQEWLRNKFPKGGGRLHDLVSMFAFSGRFGPLSKWGESDVTLGFTDLDREREGGSMRLFKASRWAEEEARNHFDPDKKLKESEWRVMKNSEEVKKKIDEYEKAYKIHVWVQTVMRNPTGVAGHVRMQTPEKSGEAPHTYLYGDVHKHGNERMARHLRNVVIQEVLGNDYIVEGRILLNGEIQYEPVENERSPDAAKLNKMARIELLERDVMTIQQAALCGGSDNRPRDIKLETDSKRIEGDEVIAGETITQEKRREDAKQYITRVQTYMLGNKLSAKDWQKKLGGDWDDTLDRIKMEDYSSDSVSVPVGSGKSKLVLKIVDTITEKNPTPVTKMLASVRGIDEDAKVDYGNPLLSEELLKVISPSHMGLEDVQWHYIDIAPLGERHWARRANDLRARSETDAALIKSLDTMRPHPDLKEIGKALEEVYNAEKQHDPNEAHRFVYLWSRGMGEMYRQRFWAKIPFLGRLISRMNPSSIAAQVYGPEHGASWSANNEREFVEAVQQSTKLPYQEIDRLGNKHTYNIHSLEKELGATRRVVIMEMIGLGVFIAIAATILAAGTKSLEDKD